jgi:hypothetical protein
MTEMKERVLEFHDFLCEASLPIEYFTPIMDKFDELFLNTETGEFKE